MTENFFCEAVSFVTSSVQQGVIPLITNVAHILRENLQLQEEIKLLKKNQHLGIVVSDLSVRKDVNENIDYCPKSSYPLCSTSVKSHSVKEASENYCKNCAEFSGHNRNKAGIVTKRADSFKDAIDSRDAAKIAPGNKIKDWTNSLNVDNVSCPYRIVGCLCIACEILSQAQSVTAYKFESSSDKASALQPGNILLLSGELIGKLVYLGHERSNISARDTTLDLGVTALLPDAAEHFFPFDAIIGIAYSERQMPSDNRNYCKDESNIYYKRDTRRYSDHCIKDTISIVKHPQRILSAGCLQSGDTQGERCDCYRKNCHGYSYPRSYSCSHGCGPTFTPCFSECHLSQLCCRHGPLPPEDCRCCSSGHDERFHPAEQSARGCYRRRSDSGFLGSTATDRSQFSFNSGSGALHRAESCRNDHLKNEVFL